ncbi:MAG TPA: porin family protein [Nitrospiraceae bacterium]|jgi:opacity protein-like surface antigen|nr:porin family protein [Nitrospiraceae bacterium]
MTPREKVIISLSIGVALLWTVPAGAEPYIAGQVGAAFPQSLSNIQVSRIPTSTTPAGTESSDLALANSGVYGAKVGYYFESLRWLGIEGEVFQLSPNVKQQIVSETPPGGATTTTLKPGANLIVNTVVLNVVARTQFGQWEPYVGVGPAGFIAQLNMKYRELGRDPLAISSGRLGLNVEAGLRYRFLNHLAVFGEWKFNNARFRFDSPAHIDATYNVHFLVIGVGYHF